MPKITYPVEAAYGDFNQNLNKLRRLAKHEMRKEKKPDLEALLALEIVDQLDSVLDEIVTALIRLEKKIDKQKPTP